MRQVERLFESVLWNSRFVVVFAVIASIAAAFATFFMSTVDVFYLIAHLTHYADPALGPTARDALRAETTTHIVEVVDGYLLATVMLIFALGLYELFVSDLAAARTSKGSSRILLIVSLDDLKSRLAKVIIMILIVKLFENALKPENEKQVEDAVKWALAEGKTFEVVGRGSKRAYGRPSQSDLTRAFCA